MEHREVLIPAPKFDLYELVTIEINDKDIKTKVTKRFFDPDTKRWSYEISSIKPVVDESALYPRDPA